MESIQVTAAVWGCGWHLISANAIGRGSGCSNGTALANYALIAKALCMRALQGWGLGAPPVDPQQRGAWAEIRVAHRYRLRGWRIVARNWLCRDGELDIVACRWTTLAVVEVRWRANADAALASIDEAKFRRTMQAAAHLIAKHGLQRYRLRFDLAAVDAEGVITLRRDCLAKSL